MTAPDVRTDPLGRLADRRFERVREVSDDFFEARADDISRACRDMAVRFHDGGRLLACGWGASRTDACHVSVEFVHPVLVGKRALPALVLEGGPGRLRMLAQPRDILMGITAGAPDGRTVEVLRTGRELGLLTIGLAGADGIGIGHDEDAVPDHLFVVPERDPTVVQEVQETLYHVLWELVHVFFDHGELL